MKPAWAGIAGWLLFVLALVLAVTAPWPHNGQALAALILGSVGVLLVARQTRQAPR